MKRAGDALVLWVKKLAKESEANSLCWTEENPLSSAAASDTTIARVRVRARATGENGYDFY